MPLSLVSVHAPTIAVAAVRRVYARWRTVSLCIACGLGILLGLSGGGSSVDRSVRQIAWKVRQTNASGQLQVVEIDARSIAAIDRWPWPRGNYAQIVDRLHQAGAASISFDVDFSSPSIAREDRIFAAAVDRAGGTVTLPTFVQEAGSNSTGWAESLPIPELRRNAALAAVSVLPDPDGYVRRMPTGVVTAGVPRPSFSAMVAGAAGATGHDFPIDFAINPASIPRHSFIDIRDGRFDPGVVRGKHVIIGATAVELGDRYAVPLYGVIPGVVIQALASETLMRGMPREGGWQLPLLLALAAGITVLNAASWRRLALRWLAGPLLAVGAVIVLDALWSWTFVVAPALFAWLLLGMATAMMRVLAEVRRRHRHDGQTGLPNRVALEEAMQTYPVAGLLIAKLTDYEKISSGLGAAATATLVQRIRDRITTVAPDCTVYRLEDRILAWRCRDRDDLERQVATLRTFMMSPVEVSGRRVDVTLGVGFAAERAEDSAARVIENAILAAAQAIKEGSNWREYHAADADTVDLELSLLGELDEAIADGQIRIQYQPKLDLRSGRIVSVEALVRWQHPVRGFLRPDLFIPLAERNDRIDRLTLHVLSSALADLRHWHECGHRLTSAVNISAKLLSDADFIAQVRTIIGDCGVAPRWLTLEVTESAAMHDPEAAAVALRSFRDMGIAISMDDYGTGQSTLSYLKQLPLSELKIDRSFVQFAHQNRGDGALVRSTVDLAHELGLKVVAEGVEDAECLDFLSSIGCDMAQGYLISRPIPAADLLEMLATSKAAA